MLHRWDGVVWWYTGIRAKKFYVGFIRTQNLLPVCWRNLQVSLSKLQIDLDIFKMCAISLILLWCTCFPLFNINFWRSFEVAIWFPVAFQTESLLHRLSSSEGRPLFGRLCVVPCTFHFSKNVLGYLLYPSSHVYLITLSQCCSWRSSDPMICT